MSERKLYGLKEKSTGKLLGITQVGIKCDDIATYQLDYIEDSDLYWFFDDKKSMENFIEFQTGYGMANDPYLNKFHKKNLEVATYRLEEYGDE